MAFLFILGQALPAHLVGGCGARAVSRKTPIYFILLLLVYYLFDFFIGGESIIQIDKRKLGLPAGGRCYQPNAVIA